MQYVTSQLSIQQLDLTGYATSEDSKLRHQSRIRTHLSYREFDTAAQFGTARLLLSKLAIADEHPAAMFDAVTAYLVEHRIELPGATTVSRLIARVRQHINHKLYRQLALRLSRAQTKRLEALLLVPKGATRTRLEQFRNEPTNLSSIGLSKALERIRFIREVGVGNVNLEDIADNRLARLIRTGLSLWPSTLQQYSGPRRLATLLVLTQHLERSAVDDALVVFDRVMRELDVRGRKRRERERLRSLKDLDAAALTLRDMARVVLDETVPAAQIRAVIREQLGETKLREAVTLVSTLVSPAEDAEIEIWERAHNTLAQFMRALLEVIDFDASPVGQSTLGALAFLKQTTGVPRSRWGRAPHAFIRKRWFSSVFPNGLDGDINRSMYAVCAMLQLHTGLTRGDIFVSGSNAHRDPRAQLLEGDAWTRVRSDVLRSLDLPATPKAMDLKTLKSVARPL